MFLTGDVLIHTGFWAFGGSKADPKLEHGKFGGAQRGAKQLPVSCGRNPCNKMRVVHQPDDDK